MEDLRQSNKFGRNCPGAEVDDESRHTANKATKVERPVNAG